MSAALESPPVSLGYANPWNALRYGVRPASAAPEGFALFPCEGAADGVEARPVFVLQKLDALGSAICRPKTGGRGDFYLPLHRVASETTLEKKREAYAEQLAAIARMQPVEVNA